MFSHRRSHFLSAEMYIAESDLKSGPVAKCVPTKQSTMTPDNQPLFPHTSRGHRIASPNSPLTLGTQHIRTLGNRE